MQIAKFVLNFLMISFFLMFIVWVGTSFDNEMTFTWYSYAIVGVLSVFYAWTKSVNMNKITDEKTVGQVRHRVVHHHTGQHRPMP